MDANLALGKELRRLRSQAGFTQADAASAAGMERSQYAHLEAGRNAISATRLTLLATCFGLKASELIAMAWERFEEDADETAGLSPPSDGPFRWTFGMHELTLTADWASPDLALARVICTCTGAVVWHRAFPGRQPLAALDIRLDTTLIHSVAGHVREDNESAAQILDAEEALLGLNGYVDSLSALQRVAYQAART